MEEITGHFAILCSGVLDGFRRKPGEGLEGAGVIPVLGPGGETLAGDGVKERGGIGPEVEEGAGVAAVLEGVEGGAELSLRGLGAAGFGGEEGGSALPSAFGHGRVSGEAL